ncbi:methyltransferase domain-containing protein [Lophiotrema nucula]|uniref:Methyltransferase domain-containing protein n=1 Tax=Lophiotrema nucula TaxID=690887 RepID=A0A6A5YHR4_9PLEO|nr:methyltransferase domain-containing protein [Lophiotrema nucula]
MGPESPLPLPAEFDDVDAYTDSLLEFATSSWLLQTLCGGVHILDFYTKEPDLYASVLPETWRTWFEERDIMDILDLLMREDLAQFGDRLESAWRGGPAPPLDLLEYLRTVRKHLLARDFPLPGSPSPLKKPKISRHITMGMKVKKIHEVENFTQYVDNLMSGIAARKKEITHLVDFGSGQNYLGRALAAPPYSKHIIAVESKQHNIAGAKNMDVLAKLVPKPVVMRNKKEYRAANGTFQKKKEKQRANGVQPQNELSSKKDMDTSSSDPSQSLENTPNGAMCNDDGCEQHPPFNPTESRSSIDQLSSPLHATNGTTTTNMQIYAEGHGSVQYVEHIIKNGDLSPVVSQIPDPSQVNGGPTTSPPHVVSEPTDLNTIPKSTQPNLMVISLHSCGNLVHHGLRSLLLNPSVSAVAMVGCCYNLVTERLGPPTYKLPTLRPNHPRLEVTANAFDPHGFPMSERLAKYPLPHPPNTTSTEEERPKGVRLNITSRMMAVQAPQNWGREDSELFFTRHFYRALLQRIFLDRAVISPPTSAADEGVSAAGHTSKVNWQKGPGLSSNSNEGEGTLTIGTLRKFAYKDFLTYVRAALQKLTQPNSFCTIPPSFIKGKMDGLSDGEILEYEEKWKGKKKELSVMWSLMAFSAGVVESLVVVDRWLWLREQEEVEECWVEPVFEYRYSPRNLVIVGIKK